MLDYKDIITKHFGLGMSGMAIAKSLSASPSEINDFLHAFKVCENLSYPFPHGTNYGIAESVYRKNPGGVVLQRRHWTENGSRFRRQDLSNDESTHR